MNITAFLQVRNELSSGHLTRFFKWNSELYDKIAVLDDASTDGTVEFLSGRADLILFNEFCGFNSELANKKKLLDAAKKAFPQTDWFIWLDADEVLFLTREKLEKMILYAQDFDFQGISFPLTNLWKSEQFFRVDSAFDSLANVRLWRNSEQLKFIASTGLHQLLHPKGINRIWYQDEVHVTHFGFASKELITRKFANYRLVGQQGKSLWRLIDETQMQLVPLNARIPSLGSRALEYFTNPNSSEVVSISSISEYFYCANTIKLDEDKQPFVSVVCLIYSGIDWLEFQYAELLRLKKELGFGEVEILFVANDATPEVVQYLKDNLIPFVEHRGKISKDEWYINSVYRAYNYGASMAKGKYVLFVNSDMAYAPGFLYQIVSRAAEKKYLVAKLIESGRLKPAPIAIKKNFGKKISSFRRKKFYRFAKTIASDLDQSGGLFMPCLLSRKVFLELGGYPEGNILKSSEEGYLNSGEYKQAVPGDKLVTGDQAFVNRFVFNGGTQITTNSAIVYHFQEGEKSTFRSSQSIRVPSGVAVANDLLVGTKKELNLWNYLLENLSNVEIKSSPVPLGAIQRIIYRFLTPNLWKKSTPRLLFRNDTFFQAFQGPWMQIVMLQDNVLDGKISSKQKKVLSKANTIVTDSTELLLSNRFLSPVRTYLLPLPTHPDWDKTPPSRNSEKSCLSVIFVGAFNSTKGWDLVRKIIERYPDISFTCISKYLDDDPEFPRGETPANVQILRCLDRHQLIHQMDQADIFIMGSQFETQCLAAMEAASRDVAICMRETGVFHKLPAHIRYKVGEFNNDLELAFTDLLKRMQMNPKSLSPLSAMRESGLSGDLLRLEWLKMVVQELEQSFTLKVSRPKRQVIKKFIPGFIWELAKKFLKNR